MAGAVGHGGRQRVRPFLQLGSFVRFGFAGRPEEMTMLVVTSRRPASVTWRCTAHNRNQEWTGTELSFELADLGPGRCELTFRHTGLPGNVVADGWRHFLASLTAHAEGGTGHRRRPAGASRVAHSVPAAAIGGDWAAAFRAGAAGLQAARQQAGDLSQEADLPIGRVSKSFVASQQIAEFAVHCWDLAAATGQRADFPAGACEAALAWARTALLPQFRGDETSRHPESAHTQF